MTGEVGKGGRMVILDVGDGEGGGGKKLDTLAVGSRCRVRFSLDLTD
jgi:hypothetical protein